MVTPSPAPFHAAGVRRRAFQFSLILLLMARNALTGSAQNLRSSAARFLTPRTCSTFTTQFLSVEKTTGAESFRTRHASSPSVWSRT